MPLSTVGPKYKLVTVCIFNQYVTVCVCFPFQALYLLLSGEALGEIALRGNVSLTVTCTTSLSYCFNIFYSGE